MAAYKANSLPIVVWLDGAGVVVGVFFVRCPFSSDIKETNHTTQPFNIVMAAQVEANMCRIIGTDANIRNNPMQNRH